MLNQNRKYPHLLPDDVIIWERYLALRGSYYDSIEYDVRVGSGQTPAPHLSVSLRKMVSDLTKKRIDAVAYHGNEIHIIEICQRVSMKTVGQCIAYPTLFEYSGLAAGRIKVLVVCERCDADLYFVLHKHNLEVIIV